jgi:hypothetical protein
MYEYRDEDAWSIALSIQNFYKGRTDVIVGVEYAHANLFYGTAKYEQDGKPVTVHYTVLMRNGRIEFQ